MVVVDNGFESILDGGIKGVDLLFVVIIQLLLNQLIIQVVKVILSLKIFLVKSFKILKGKKFSEVKKKLKESKKVKKKFLI